MKIPKIPSVDLSSVFNDARNYGLYIIGACAALLLYALIVLIQQK